MSINPLLPQDAVPVPLTVPVAIPENDPVAPDIETASGGYALRFSGPAGEYLLGQQAMAVGSLLDDVGDAPLHFLDVGGGHAQLTSLFLRRGHNVTVHGSATACFPRVLALQKEFPDRLSCLMGPLRRLPVEDSQFDVVCGFRLMAHVANWRDLVAEFCRASRRFVICEFAVLGGLQRLAGAMFPLKLQMEPDTRPFTIIAIEDVVAELERHGFRLVRIERQFVMPIALHRALKSPVLSRCMETWLARLGLRESVGSPAVLLAERVT